MDPGYKRWALRIVAAPSTCRQDDRAAHHASRRLDVPGASGHAAGTLEPAPAVKEVEEPRVLARTERVQDVGVHETERAQTGCLGAVPVHQSGRRARRGLRRDLGHGLEQAAFRGRALLGDMMRGLLEHLGQLDRRRADGRSRGCRQPSGTDVRPT